MGTRFRYMCVRETEGRTEIRKEIVHLCRFVINIEKSCPHSDENTHALVGWEECGTR